MEITVFQTTPMDLNSKSVALSSEYFERYEELKREENWVEIVRLGNLALLDGNLSNEQRAKIHAQLSSTSFYLGNYADCKGYAEGCMRLSEYLEDSTLLLRSLYLVSAYYRAQGNQMNPSDLKGADQAFKEGREFILQALNYLEACSCEFTKGKVYFNAGA